MHVICSLSTDVILDRGFNAHYLEDPSNYGLVLVFNLFAVSDEKHLILIDYFHPDALNEA